MTTDAYHDYDNEAEGYPESEMTEVIAQLQQYRSRSEPTLPDKAKLLARLTPLVQARQTVKAPRDSEWDWRHWLSLVRAQLSILEAPFWIANLMVFALGILLGVSHSLDALALAYMMVAPLLATIGVAYVFRPATRGLWELEHISPVRPIELLYARLIPVLAFSGVITLCLLGVIWVQVPDLLLWRMLLVWFGPMLALAGVALYCSVRWGGIAGIAVPVMLWSGVVLFGSTVLWDQSGQAVKAVGRGSWLWQLVGHSDALVIGALLAVFVAGFLLAQAQRLVADPR